jgi:hypothetical protein
MVADVPFFCPARWYDFFLGPKKGPKTKKGAKKRPQKGKRKGATKGVLFCLSSAPTTNMPHAEHCGPSFVWRMYCNLHETVREKERFDAGGFFFFLPAARASSPRRRSSGPSSCARPYTRIETPSLLFFLWKEGSSFWIREQRRNAPFKASRPLGPFFFFFLFFLFFSFFYFFSFFSFFSFHSHGGPAYFLCRDPRPKTEENQKRNRLTSE